MGKAWPRFFPDATTEAIVHALLIEAHAILVEQLGEGRADLLRVHRQAIAYACAHYSEDEIRAALEACTVAAGSCSGLLTDCEALGERQSAPQPKAELAAAA